MGGLNHQTGEANYKMPDKKGFLCRTFQDSRIPARFQGSGAGGLEDVRLVAAWQLQSTSFLMPEMEFWCSPEELGGDTGNGSSAWVSPGGDPCNMYDVDYSEVTRPDLLPLQPENTTCTRWEYSRASTPES